MIPLHFDGSGDPVLPYGPLVEALLPPHGGVASARIRVLSGGLSGASVIAVFPEGQGNLKPFVVKIARPEQIQDELRRYTDLLAPRAAVVSEPRIARLEPHGTTRPPEATGVDGRPYQAIAYEYVNPDGLQDARPFAELCLEGGATPAVFGRLVAALERVFYCQVSGVGKCVPPFAIPEIPWDGFLPVATAAAVFVPGWLEFLRSLPKRWSRPEDPISFQPVVCHGDLRCANVLVRGDGDEPFLIDFGLTRYDHPLADLPRLEADLLFRVAPELADHVEVLGLVLKEQRLAPQEWERHPIPLVQLLWRLRCANAQLADRAHIGQDAAARLHRLLLLGNAVRFARRHDPSAPGEAHRLDYLWFVLSLASRLLGGDDLERPPSLETQRDMRECGVVDFFWGPDRRNQRKLELLDHDSGPIRLLAHTGHSFLDDQGPFFQALERCVSAPGRERVEIVLLNPYSLEGGKLGIAEARGDLLGPELDVEYFEQSTELFRRFRVCLDSYLRLRTLRNGETNPRIELRITDFSPDATILLSQRSAFFEPYVVGRLTRRYHTGVRMNAPELLAPRGTPLYEVAESQFEFFWKRAISVDEFRRREDEFKAEFMRSARLRRKSEALHESWFAVDPIVGCPNRCQYCFLLPYGVNGRPAPYMFRTAREAYTRLRNHDWFKKQLDLLRGSLRNDPRLPVPIACGNYTEMLDDEHPYRPSAGAPTTNLRELELLVAEHARLANDLSRAGIRAPPLCIITKQAIPESFVTLTQRTLEQNPSLRLAVFVSLSFLPQKYEGGGASIEHRLENFRVLGQLNRQVGGGEAAHRRVAGIHFWRPLVPGFHAAAAALAQLRRVREHGAVSSVAVGLKLSQRLKGVLQGQSWTSDGGERVLDFPELSEGEWFDERVKEDVVTAGRELGHPVFLHTSCAVSHAFGRPDYNATFDGARPPARSLVDQLLGACLLPGERARLESDAEGHAWLELDPSLEVEQELQTFLQQMLGIPVSARIRRTHEWSGSASAPRHGAPCRASHCPEAQQQICGEFYARR